MRVRHPDASPAELLELTKATYRGKTPEAVQRQKSTLLRGANKAGKRRKQSDKTPRRRRGTPDGDLEGMDILEFASGPLGLRLHPAQRVVLASMYGLPLAGDDLALYGQLTGGLTEQHGAGHEALEAVLCLGARSGKSLLLSVIAIYECLARGHHWRRYLRKGEIGYCAIVATRLQQAQDIIGGNAARMVSESERLSGYLKCEPTLCKIEFRNGLTILSLPCNSTAGRGLPIFLLEFDELAHYYTEGVKADVDIYNSLSPRLAQFRGAKTVMGSTPAAKQGMFHSWFNEGFTVDGRATFQAPSTVMNPSLDPDYLARMKQRDPDNYSREFDAQFAERLSSYFKTDDIESALVLAGDVPPVEGVHYCLGLDQSGLSGRDRFAACVSHIGDDGIVVADAVRSWDASDDSVIGEVAALAKPYGIDVAICDQYASGWVASALAKAGLDCERRPGLPQVYSNLKSLMIAQRLKAPDNSELKDGLGSTVGYYGRNNSLSIGHPRTRDGHGDLADALATSAWAASGRPDAAMQALSDTDIKAMVSTEAEAFYAA